MLSNLIEELVVSCFELTEQSKARSLLEHECSTGLPMVDDDAALIERIQVAVIKLSRGNLDALVNCINEAQDDWRDVLDAAGFYNDTKAHLNWKP